MERLYKAYKDKVQFYLIYIREAHPVRSANTRTRRGPSIAQHKTMDERILAATKCIQGLKISLPTLIDKMEGEGSYLKSYGGFPAGTNVIDKDGKIAFSSRGPWGAQPKQAKDVLDKLLSQHGRLSGKPGPVKKSAAKTPVEPAARKAPAKPK